MLGRQFPRAAADEQALDAHLTDDALERTLGMEKGENQRVVQPPREARETPADPARRSADQLGDPAVARPAAQGQLDDQSILLLEQADPLPQPFGGGDIELAQGPAVLKNGLT